MRNNHFCGNKLQIPCTLSDLDEKVGMSELSRVPEYRERIDTEEEEEGEESISSSSRESSLEVSLKTQILCFTSLGTQRCPGYS